MSLRAERSEWRINLLVSSAYFQIRKLVRGVYTQPVEVLAATSLPTQTPAKISRVFVYTLPHMRKFIIVVVLFLGAAFVYLSFGELESIAHT
ncbi:MAG TPA: hypothetical protein VLE49_16990, partial [Anaerolineales bacterium]|nr:hypothetical protein [Anaerolineales bacterium]